MAHLQTVTITQYLYPKIMNWLKCWRKNSEIHYWKWSETLKGTQKKQINEVRQSTQDLDKKAIIMEEKFSKGMEIMKHNQVEMLEMNTLLN
jgi:hypothetical protein